MLRNENLIHLLNYSFIQFNSFFHKIVGKISLGTILSKKTFRFIFARVTSYYIVLNSSIESQEKTYRNIFGTLSFQILK